MCIMAMPDHGYLTVVGRCKCTVKLNDLVHERNVRGDSQQKRLNAC